MPKGARKDACALQKNKNAGQQRGTVISRVADARARRKSQSGMHFLPNVAGGMKPATTCKRPRGDQVLPIARVFKPGWTCMTPKKAEHRGDDLVSLFCDARALAFAVGILIMTGPISRAGSSVDYERPWLRSIPNTRQRSKRTMSRRWIVFWLMTSCW